MKKLFTNDKFFLAMVLCALVGNAMFVLFNVIEYNFEIQGQLPFLFCVACVIALYISYKQHSKNIMKGMMGALLASQVLTAFQFLSEMVIVVDYICFPLFALFSLLLFINHFVINADRKASPKNIRFNQVLVILLIVNNTIWDICRVIVRPDFDCIATIVVNAIGFVGMAAVVVCVESRLDAYRLDREAAGWTEETGYPEGYVHEYEKK